jgi:hypothetical protein
MATVTLDVPEHLARQLRTVPDDELPRLLESALRAMNAEAAGEYQSLAEVIEFLVWLPSPEQTLALRPSKALQTRIATLLKKNREEGLTGAEAREWEAYQYLEHLVRLAKARAQIRLNATNE